MVLGIVLMSTKGWYIEHYKNFSGASFTLDIGLLKYKVCSYNFCVTGPNSDFDDGGVSAASWLGFFGMLLALVFSVTHLLCSILVIVKKPLGKANPGQLALVSVFLVELCYVLVLVFYPIFFGGITESGNYIDYTVGFSYSYYLLIVQVILAGTAFALYLFFVISNKKAAYNEMA